MRIALMVFRMFFRAIYYLIQIDRYGKSDKYTEEQRFLLLKKTTTEANKAGRVTIKSYGLEHIPQENGYIMYPNHQGLFDVLGLLESCTKPFSVVMKKEVGNIILLKQVIRCLRGQLIERDNIRQGLEVIKKMTEEVKNGRNYVIFAEGTRTRNKNELLDFKGGSFKAAINAKCPIVPVALIDSYKPFDENSIKPVTIQIHYLEPIYFEEYQNMKSTEIAKMVKDRIEHVIKENE
ncbi:MAG: 1-acyl-sn-glycerol-3-phosphate acyltransferase [Crenarchaeota archaeon]|nr:1-acyl-sn-glycerol-3-phosphate acyltransferase [Thermoproteota archaeon]